LVQADVCTTTSLATVESKLLFSSAISGLGAGDEVHVSKTPDPANSGQNATFTDDSATVTLTSAVTTDIYNFEATTGWVSGQGANVTFSVTAVARQGSNFLNVIAVAAAGSGIQGYYPFGSALNLSARQTISFWVMMSADTTGTANNYSLRFCSDAAGATPVHTIYLNGCEAGQWKRFVFDNGAALSSNINSISVHCGTDIGAMTVSLDCAWASNARTASDYIGLDTLISKNSAANGGAEPWLAIDSITGTTILLASPHTNTAIGTRAKYQGTTATTTLYLRTMVLHSVVASATSTALDSISTAGAEGSTLKIRGGFNPVTDTQDGYTWIYSNGNGYGMTLGGNYEEIQRLGYVDCYFGIYVNAINCIITNCSVLLTGQTSSCGIADGSSAVTGQIEMTLDYLWGNWSQAISASSAKTIIIHDILHCSYNNAASLNQIIIRGIYKIVINKITLLGRTLSGVYDMMLLNANYIILNDITAYDMATSSLLISIAALTLGLISNCTFTCGNGASACAITNNYGSTLYFYNCVFNGNAEIQSVSSATWLARYPAFVSVKHDGTDNNDIGKWLGTSVIYGQFSRETTTRHTASGSAWKCESKNSGAHAGSPNMFELANIALKANEAKTITLWVYRDSTNIFGRIRIPQHRQAGITAEITNTCSGSTTTWEQLSISVNPTIDCVLPVIFEFWGGTTNYIIIDDFGVA
jgi:hypothetical protein